MKLRFRGKTYSQYAQQIVTIASKNVACYRGQRYVLPMPVVTATSKLPESLISAVVYKYRGVSYVNERHFPKHSKKLVHH